MPNSQATDAQKLYDGRASKYDASFHDRFTSHVVQLLDPKPGEHILDLACGTGQVSFKAAKLVGSFGGVCGIDISTGMLAEAQAKLSTHDLGNIEFHQHSTTDLESLPQLQDRKFDAIACASALVLLPEPQASLQAWVKYLKPGGRLITDVTHPRNLLPGMVLERVGRILNAPVPSYREVFQKPEDLASLMEVAGLVDVKTIRISQHKSRTGTDDMEDFLAGSRKPLVLRTYIVEEAATIFDRQVETPFGASMAEEPVRSKARELFEREWAALADRYGILTDVDEVFVGQGRSPN